MRNRAFWLPALCAAASLAVLPACRSTRRKCCPKTPAPQVADTPDAGPMIADSGGTYTPSAPMLTAPSMPIAQTPMAPPMMESMPIQSDPYVAPAPSDFPVADATPMYDAAPPMTEYVPSDELAPATADSGTSELDDRLEATNRRLIELENEIMAGNTNPPAASASVASGGGELSQLENSLRSQAGTEVIRQGDTVIVRMTDAFRSGSDLLKQDVQLVTALNATASALKQYPGAQVNVVGHSDSQPIVKTRDKWQSNRHLSQARAERVASLLTRNGVDAGRIYVDGRGAREPLVAERSARDRAKNRRVEIMIKM